MNLAKLSDIDISDRQRKHYANPAMQELYASIAEKGLFHPILCRQEGEKLHLVGGERRRRAIQRLADEGKQIEYDGALIPLGEIPYTILGDLSELQFQEAELEENVAREDLTWQEESAALVAIHSLRKKQNPKQTVTETARELSERKVNTSESAARKRLAKATIIQSNIDDPDVQKAKSLHEAYRIASDKQVGKFVLELSKREKAKALKRSPHALILGDMREVEWGENEFAFIIADPPYGIHTEKFGSQAGQRHRYTDTKEEALAISKYILERGFRATTVKAHLAMFCDVDNFLTLRDFADSTGWGVWRTPLVWHKGSQGHAPFGSSGWRREYELILFCIKDGKPLQKLSGDLLTFPSSKEREHAAAKPLPLYAHLIRSCCRPGDKVLDPCCGSGIIFPAAFTTDTRATGIEIDDAAYAQSHERLVQAIERSRASANFVKSTGTGLDGMSIEAVEKLAEEGED